MCFFVRSREKGPETVIPKMREKREEEGGRWRNFKESFPGPLFI